MPLSSVTQQFEKCANDRLHQGDIFRDLSLSSTEYTGNDKKELTLTEYPLAYCVLITQDCDLEQDAKNRADHASQSQDKYLRSLLVLPAYVAEQLRDGNHIKDDDSNDQRTIQHIPTDKWKLITSNQSFRYHFLSGDEGLQIPNLVLDFKHYVTVSRAQLYQQAGDKYIGTINTLFRENLSNRFAHYLSRIGLPELSSQE